jgi:oxygen-independent coproporphyrinogen-3 oxidase
VSLKQKDRVVKALHEELRIRRNEFSELNIETIYFGGGTPTVLSSTELALLLETINRFYHVLPDAEVTIEANPDDLSNEYLFALKADTWFNRISIGTQSFDDTDLKLMNRRHTAEEAYRSILMTKDAGFSNLNIDLIYGVPGMNMERWQRNLEIFASLGIPHLSAYHLTFEPKTVFTHYQKKGKLKPINEELSLAQFEFLLGFMQARGFEHYEISNFSYPDCYSRHNVGYWTGKPYLGIGPSAHTYLMNSRRWNVANNSRYCDALEAGSNTYFETETLDTISSYHDYILTSLRTKWGIDREKVLAIFGKEISHEFTKLSQSFLDKGMLIEENNRIILPDRSKFLADHIISGLMLG